MTTTRRQLRVLLVEDNAVLRRALSIALSTEGHQVVLAADGRTALQAVREDEPDVVVLDLGLPDMDGTDVVSAVRSGSSLPIVILSARDESSDKVSALDIGADDYVTKPFDTEELLARVRVAGRRSQAPAPPDLESGELRISLADRTVTRAGETVHLTPTEWRIIDVMAAADGRLVSQKDLLERVWGAGYERETGYLRTYVSTLRRKLESDPSRPQHLLTEPGQGYRLAM